MCERILTILVKKWGVAQEIGGDTHCDSLMVPEFTLT